MCAMALGPYLSVFLKEVYIANRVRSGFPGDQLDYSGHLPDSGLAFASPSMAPSYTTVGRTPIEDTPGTGTSRKVFSSAMTMI